MAKKYFENFRLDLAYNHFFKSLDKENGVPILAALEISSGVNLPKSKMLAGDFPVYGGGGLTNETHSDFNFDFKTLGIGRVGARCGCVFEIGPQSWVTDNALAVTKWDQRFNLQFLKHYLAYLDLGQYANNAMQPVISKTRISHIQLPVLPISEQVEIAGILDKIQSGIKISKEVQADLFSNLKIIDSWEKLVSEIQSQKSLLSQLKQSILQEAIQGKLTSEWRAQRQADGIETEPASELLKRIQAEKARLINPLTPLRTGEKRIKKEKPLPSITEAEKPFELPEGWEWSRLGEVADVQRGIGPRYSENGVLKMINQKCVRWFNIEVIHSKSIDKEWFESLDDNRKTKSLDLLVNSTGDGTIGRSAIVDQLAVGFAFDSHVLRVRPYLDFISFYLAICINSSYGQGLIEDLKGAKSTKQTELGSTNLSSFSISVPPFEEQKAIVEKVESLMEKCRTLEEEISQSEQHAQMLMQAVLKEAFEN